MKPLNILSLFDWMSCGMIALERVWIPVNKYYASEIDKYSILISKKNYPDIIHLWDVNNWRDWDLSDIDLIIWGSPCQWFSLAGKQLAFDDPRSKLFFTMVDIINHYKPKYFLLENVKMKKEHQEVITQYMWVQPIEINSSLVSAQNRKRLYWTNIPWIEQPQEKWILLKDILEGNVDEKYNISNKHTEAMINARSSWKLNIPDLNWKCWTIISSYYKIPQDWPYIKQLNNPSHSNNRIYWIDGKSPTLNTMQWWNRQPKIYIPNTVDNIRKLTPLECERLQTLPDDYTEWVSNSQRYKMLWNWRTVDVIAHIFSYLNTTYA